MKEMRYIIDRMEDKFAICECEDRSMTHIEKDKLYEGAKPGDHFVVTNGVSIFDEVATKKAKKMNIALQNNLFDD